MRKKMVINVWGCIALVLAGVVLTWVGSVFYNEIDFHAKCDGTVLSDTWGNNYCIPTELLKGTRNP